MNDSSPTPTSLSYDPSFKYPAKFPVDPVKATQTPLYIVGKHPRNWAFHIALPLAYIGAVLPLIAFLAFLFALIGYFNKAGRNQIKRSDCTEIMVISGIFIALQIIAFLIMYLNYVFK